MRKITTGISAVAAMCLLVANTGKAGPMGTAFTYQGKLNDGGAPATGLYDFTFRLFDGPNSITQLGVDVPLVAVPVTNGLFTVRLDFVDNVHPVSGVYDGSARWLEISANTNASPPSLLLPRQELTPQAYAVYAARAASASLADSATSVPWSGIGVTLGPGIVASPGGFSIDPSFGDDRFWKLGGNTGTSPGANFLGTSDNKSFELHVNNQRALWIRPTAGVPNLIGGSLYNGTAAGVEGAVIGGGGTAGGDNSIYASFASLAGGVLNRIDGHHGFLGGGGTNRILSSAGFGVLAGGQGNQLGGDHGVVSGGWSNNNQTALGTIGGGANNLNQASYSATIAGGYQNTVQGQDATIGGGSYNTNTANYGTIAGGTYNTLNASYATIAGGTDNQLGVNGFPLVGLFSVIGGGAENLVRQGNATVAGGQDNRVDGNAEGAAIPGGFSAHAYNFGQHVFASGFSDNRGDAQSSLYVLRRNTSGASTYEMFLDGNNASKRIYVPPGSVWAIRIHVAGVNIHSLPPTLRVDFAAYEASGIVANLPIVPGRPNQIELHLYDGAGNPITTARPLFESTYVDSAVPWQATPYVDPSDNTLRIAVNGALGVEVKWTATIQTTEVLIQ